MNTPPAKPPEILNEIRPDKSDSELKNAIALNEKFALSGAGAVVLGLLLEILFAAAFHEPPETMLSHWGPVAADTIVAVGVAVEVFFGRKSRIDSEELTRRSEERVAAANERAANAELEAQRLRDQFSWRTLSPEQMIELSTVLGSRAGTIVISYLANDPGSQYLAYVFRAVFQMAKWQVRLEGGSYPAVWFGIIVPEPEGPSVNSQTLVRYALTIAGFGFSIAPVPRWSRAMIIGSQFGDDAAQMFIGAKAPAFADIVTEPARAPP